MKEVNKLLNIFISYVENDKQSLAVREFVKEIGSYSEVDQIILCETDRNQDCLFRCLNFSNNMIDVCIFFCSEEARHTLEMCEEINFAFYSGVEIIPIYKNYSDIFPLIRHKEGVKITEHGFNPQNVVKDVIHIIRKGKEGGITN